MWNPWPWKGYGAFKAPEKPNVVENHSLMGGGRDMELENGEGPIHARSPKLGWGSGNHMKREK